MPSSWVSLVLLSVSLKRTFNLRRQLKEERRMKRSLYLSMITINSLWVHSFSLWVSSSSLLSCLSVSRKSNFNASAAWLAGLITSLSLSYFLFSPLSYPSQERETRERELGGYTHTIVRYSPALLVSHPPTLHLPLPFFRNIREFFLSISLSQFPNINVN